jgi:hypothetical protein
MSLEAFEDRKTLAKIDAMAEELRDRLQGGKRLTPWDETPRHSKRKWIEHARALYVISAQTEEGEE